MNILQEVNTILDEFNYFSRVAVKINGRLYYFTEYQIRALQVLVARKYGKSKELFKEFNNSVQVYSSFIIKDSHRMNFRTDGRFSNEFDDGFFNINSNMAFELF